MINPAYNVFGCAFTVSESGTYYWTQQFAAIQDPKRVCGGYMGTPSATPVVQKTLQKPQVQRAMSPKRQVLVQRKTRIIESNKRPSVQPKTIVVRKTVVKPH